MTSDATTNHLSPDTRNLTCIGTKYVHKLRKGRREYTGAALVGSLGGLLWNLPSKGLDHWLLDQEARLWLAAVTLVLLVWWGFSRLLAHGARWSKTKLTLSKAELTICYSACRPTLELKIPWSAIAGLETESSDLQGDMVVIRIGDPTIAEQLWTAVRSRFGSGLWMGTPWYEGLRVLSDSPPAADVSNLLMVWRNRHSRSPAPAKSPGAAPAIPPTKLAPHVDAQTEVNLSSASYAELLRLPGIGAAEAALIMKYRVETGGPYSIQELVNLLQMKPHSAERLRGKVTFSKPDPGASPKPNRKSEPTSQSEVKRPSQGRVID